MKISLLNINAIYKAPNLTLSSKRRRSVCAANVLVWASVLTWQLVGAQRRDADQRLSEGLMMLRQLIAQRHNKESQGHENQSYPAS